MVGKAKEQGSGLWAGSSLCLFEHLLGLLAVISRIFGPFGPFVGQLTLPVCYRTKNAQAIELFPEISSIPFWDRLAGSALPKAPGSADVISSGISDIVKLIEVPGAGLDG